MAPNTKTWAHLGALGAYFPLSALRARACNDYPELAPDAPIAPTDCELNHDWQAAHPQVPRRTKRAAWPIATTATTI